MDVDDYYLPDCFSLAISELDSKAEIHWIYLGVKNLFEMHEDENIQLMQIEVEDYYIKILGDNFLQVHHYINHKYGYISIIGFLLRTEIIKESNLYFGDTLYGEEHDFIFTTLASYKVKQTTDLDHKIMRSIHVENLTLKMIDHHEEKYIQLLRFLETIINDSIGPKNNVSIMLACAKWYPKARNKKVVVRYFLKTAYLIGFLVKNPILFNKVICLGIAV